MEGTATDLHMLLLGFLHRGSRRMAGRGMGSRPADATAHLSDTYEATREDRGAPAEDVFHLRRRETARLPDIYDILSTMHLVALAERLARYERREPEIRRGTHTEIRCGPSQSALLELRAFAWAAQSKFIWKRD